MRQYAKKQKKGERWKKPGKNVFFFLKAVDKLFELLVRITEAELIKSGLH